MFNRRFGFLAALFLVPVVQAQSPGNRYINPPGLVKPTGPSAS
jgi:hypothetical protein